MNARFLFTLLVASLLPAVALGAPAAEPLVTRLEADHVDITSAFAGENLLLFGSVSQGTDVIIKLVSPEQVVALSQKVKVGPLWLDSGHMTVRGTPGLMYLLSSEPIDTLLGPAQQAQYGLRLQDALARAEVSEADEGVEDWHSAFLKLKHEKGYYVEDGHAVGIEKGRLFFTSITLPPKSPIGDYDVEIYSIRNGQVVQQDTSHLTLQEVRLEHWVDNVAHTNPWGFGSAFTLGVMVLGLLLGMLLRRKRGT